MIINKTTKCFLTRSDKPNENWTNNDDYIVVADDSEIAKVIMEKYPNIELVIENDELKDVVIISMTENTALTHKEINSMVVAKIREKYDVNEEFKMINLGITDPSNKEYIAYRSYVQECVDWGNSLEEGGDE